MDAQFWVPEDWNPTVTVPPGSGMVRQKWSGRWSRLAEGVSEEVFLLTMQLQPSMPSMAGGPHEGASAE